MLSRQFFQEDGEFSGDPSTPAVIGAAACNYRHGFDERDLDDVLNHLTGMFESLDRQDGFVAYTSTPAVGAGPNSADVYMYGVQGTAADWAARTVAMQSSPAGPMLAKHFDTVLDCDQSLFFGQRVVPKAE